MDKEIIKILKEEMKLLHELNQDDSIYRLEDMLNITDRICRIAEILQKSGGKKNGTDGTSKASPRGDKEQK